MNLGAQLGPMSIIKLSRNWACQMGPIHCPKFLLSGSWRLIETLSDPRDAKYIYISRVDKQRHTSITLMLLRKMCTFACQPSIYIYISCIYIYIYIVYYI